MAEMERVLKKLDNLSEKVTTLTIEVRATNGLKPAVNKNTDGVDRIEGKIDNHCLEEKTKAETLIKIAKKGGSKYTYSMLGVMAFISLGSLVVMALTLILK